MTEQKINVVCDLDAIELFLDLGEKLGRSIPISDAVLQRTRLALLDTLAAGIAGTCAPGMSELTGLCQEWGGAGQSSLLTGGRAVSAPVAALLNGACMRAWDLDDVHEQNTAHVSASVVPAALAVAQAKGGSSGRDLLAAIALGNELVCRITSAPKLTFSESGMAPGYQAAFFGAAMAAARLLRLDRDRWRNAMGLAYARVAGNLQCYTEGTMAVRLMQGIAAEAGVVSAQMAQRGLTGSSKVLEGKFGYFPVFQRGQYDPVVLREALGEVWQFLDVSIKPLYPCCKYTHGPVEAAIQAMQTAGVPAENIARVDIEVSNREVYDLVCEVREQKWNPQGVAQCQFSLPYTVAYAIVHGRLGFEAFTHTGMQDGQVRLLMPRIHAHLVADVDSKHRGVFPMPGKVVITLDSGKKFSKEVIYVKGHPRNPMSFEDVVEKTRQCGVFAGTDSSVVESLITAVADIEQSKDAGELARLASMAMQGAAK